MNQAPVKFSKEFITPSGLKEWVGIEWPVGVEVDKEAIFATLDKVRDAVLGWYEKDGPMTQPGGIAEIRSGEGLSGAQTEADILKSKDLVELTSFASFINRNPQFAAAYNKRLKELSNGKQPVKLP